MDEGRRTGWRTGIDNEKRSKSCRTVLLRMVVKCIVGRRAHHFFQCLGGRWYSHSSRPIALPKLCRDMSTTPVCDILPGKKSSLAVFLRYLKAQTTLKALFLDIGGRLDSDKAASIRLVQQSIYQTASSSPHLNIRVLVIVLGVFFKLPLSPWSTWRFTVKF